MKKIFLLYIFIFLSQSFFAQTRTDPGVSVETERDRDGHITYIANNKDHCPYYVILHFPDLRGYTLSSSNPYKKNIRTGKSNLFKLRKIAGETGYSSYSWFFYRGDANAKLNLDYIYSLPIKPNDSIEFKVNKNYKYEMIFNMKHTNDTVYASRAGVICDNRLYDSSTTGSKIKDIITIYHKDGSFSSYAGNNESLVNEGRHIEVGQPIAVIKPNKKGLKLLLFSVYFLDKNKLDEKTANVHSGLIPTFHTLNKGNTRLEEKTIYIAATSDELKTQDMSKKEKEKYFKKKNK